jgi:hypothetical protein
MLSRRDGASGQTQGSRNFVQYAFIREPIAVGVWGSLSSNLGIACAYLQALGIRGPSVKIHSAAKRSYSAGGVVRYWAGSSHRLYWLNREPDEHSKGAVENLKEVITSQAMILALDPPAGG